MAGNAVVIIGCAGRMGRALIEEAIGAPGLTLAGGVERAGHPAIGTDLGPLAGLPAVGLAVGDALEPALARADAAIDFSTATASATIARAAAAAGVALVIGATGADAAATSEIEAAARRIAIVRSGNFSLGVNLLAGLVEEAARRLPDEFDVEIFEAHHRDKIDAPSGTALMLAEAAARGRGVELEGRAVLSRSGATGPRKAGEIGFSVMRGGGIIGEHAVSFAGSREVVTLSHSAIDRRLFARGAMVAAKWALSAPPGLYSMRDVLGFAARR